MTFRRRAMATAGTTVLAVAMSMVGSSPTAAATSSGIVPPAEPAPPACSTDIIGRGPGAAAGRHVEFSYTLAGGQCRGSIYALIIRNTYDPKQIGIFTKLGDGQSKDVFFSQDLPFTPTQLSPTGALEPGEAGLCVVGVTTRGLRVDDVAPDPADAPCEPLKGGTARAFH